MGTDILSPYLSGDYVERTDWNLGKAFGGGPITGDSPYYNAFYNKLDELFFDTIKAEDPVGLDYYIYGPLTDEKLTPQRFQEKYPEEYERALQLAEKAGREAQIKDMQRIISYEHGEEYHDLRRLLERLDTIEAVNAEDQSIIVNNPVQPINNNQAAIDSLNVITQSGLGVVYNSIFAPDSLLNQWNSMSTADKALYDGNFDAYKASMQTKWNNLVGYGHISADDDMDTVLKKLQGSL